MPQTSRARLLVCQLLMLLVLSIASTARAAPLSIQIGTFVTSLSGVNLADGSFRIDARLWFIAPDRSFDPVNDIHVIARQATLSLIEQHPLPNGAVYSSIRLKATVDQAYELRDFPFTRQALTLRLEARQDVGHIQLVPDLEQSGIADFVSLPGWQIEALQLTATSVYYETNFGLATTRPDYSRTNVVIDVAQDRSPLIFEKFSGYLVALIISTLVFAVPFADLGTRLGMTTSSIFAAVFNRYRLGDSVGFDSSFGLMDQISLLTLGAIIAALTISLLTFNFIGTRSAADIKSLDRRLGVGSMIVFWALIVSVFGAVLL